MHAVETRSSYYFGHLHARTEWAGRRTANLKRSPERLTLVLTAVDSEHVIRDCLEADVRGWVFKPDPSEDLMTTVEANATAKDDL